MTCCAFTTVFLTGGPTAFSASFPYISSIMSQFGFKGLPAAKSETAHPSGSVPLTSTLGELRAPHIRKERTQCGHRGSVANRLGLLLSFNLRSHLGGFLPCTLPHACKCHTFGSTLPLQSSNAAPHAGDLGRTFLKVYKLVMSPIVSL